MLCQSCGKSIEDNIAYCTHCATRVPRGAVAPEPLPIPDSPPLVTPPLAPPSSWNWIWPSIVGVLLAKLFGLVGCLVAIGAYYWLKPKLGAWGALAASGVLGVIAVGLLAMLRT